MIIHVLYFAHAADATGIASEDIELPEGTTVAELLKLVCEHHPKVDSLRDSLAIAINRSYGNHEVVLRHNQTVALIPPVSGG